MKRGYCFQLMPQIKNRCVEVQEGGVQGEKDGRREKGGKNKRQHETGREKGC